MNETGGAKGTVDDATAGSVRCIRIEAELLLEADGVGHTHAQRVNIEPSGFANDNGKIDDNSRRTSLPEWLAASKASGARAQRHGMGSCLLGRHYVPRHTALDPLSLPSTQFCILFQTPKPVTTSLRA